MSYKREIVFLSILSLFVFLIYAVSLKNGFVNWDDNTHLLNNPAVQSLDFFNLQRIFSQFVSDVYIPLTVLSFAFEYHFFGYNAFIYHLDNIILFIGLMNLIYIFLRRLKINQTVAFFSVCLFGIHPVHVESVAWVTERKDVLYAFFYILALHSYWSFLECGKKRYYVLTLLLGLLSMLSKSMAVSLPLTLLLIDWFKGRTDLKNALVQKIPFLLYVLPLAWITHRLNWETVSLNSDLIKAFFIAVWSFTFYLKKFFFPLELRVVYETPLPINLTNPNYIFSLLILMALVFFLVRFRKNRMVIFSFMFFVIGIFMLIRFDELKGSPNVVSERFLYFPCLGFCLWFGLGVEYMWLRFQKYRKPLLAGIMIIFVLLSLKTYHQIQIWKDSLTLWNYVIKILPNFAIAYNNRGNYWMSVNKVEPALEDFNQALSINPFYAEALNNRGVIYESLNRSDLARKDFENAVAVKPYTAEFLYNLAGNFQKNNQHDSAIDFYSKAITFNPYFDKAYNNRGVSWLKKGNYEQAISDLSKAIEINSLYADPHNNRGNAYFMIGEYQAALADFEEALKIDPHCPNAENNRSLITEMIRKHSGNE